MQTRLIILIIVFLTSISAGYFSSIYSLKNDSKDFIDISLEDWTLNDEKTNNYLIMQNEVIKIDSLWKTDNPLNKLHSVVFDFFDENGVPISRIYSKEIPLKEQPSNKHSSTFYFKFPYVNPGRYSFNLGVIENSNEIENSNKQPYFPLETLGNIEIVENPDFIPCGLIISDVAKNVPASKMGIKEGEKVIAINGNPVELKETLLDTINNVERAISDDSYLEIKTDKNVYTIESRNQDWKFYHQFGIWLGFYFCEK